MYVLLEFSLGKLDYEVFHSSVITDPHIRGGEYPCHLIYIYDMSDLTTRLCSMFYLARSII
jgi:hypothetical protein